MIALLLAATSQLIASDSFLFRTPSEPIATSPKTLKIETLKDADAFFRMALRGSDNRPSGVGCATPEAMHARDMLVENNPAHGIVAEILIHGEVSEYLTPMFKFLYTKDASSTDVPPLADTNATIPMPDGSTRTLVAGNGVPDYVEKAGHYMEHARAVNGSLGLELPSPRTEVRIVNVDRSYSMAIIGITLSNHAPEWYLPWLCAHEFFHQVQVASTPGDFGISFAKLNNPAYYDTFPLEGTANTGADFSFGVPGFGSQTPYDPNDHFAATDIDFWNQSYDSSVFWKYLIQQLATQGQASRGITVGSEIMRLFWQKRGSGLTGTPSALRQTLQATGGEFEAFLKRYRVAMAVKGHFNVDPTVPSTNRAFDWVGDGASNWPAVALQKQLDVGAGPSQNDQGEIQEDRGAKYYRILPGGAASYVFRLVGGSDDVRTQVAQVWQRQGQRGVAVTEIAGRDGKNDVTITVESGVIATYAIVESTDGTQPFVIDINPKSEKVPDLGMRCGSAVPVGAPESGRDTAAAVQITLLVAAMMLAVRLHRRRG
ncbi:MAG: hypothetical protein IT381_30465 [Deltaproteobacteria bacterium]|nr:hypothetical protein [Deltaproteobacteria bacterium]